MSDNYIDILFDGPPSSEGGRFIEIENEDGYSISAGEWLEPKCSPANHSEGEACGEQFWRLRLKVHPGLDNLATKINDISTAHGFWPEHHEEKQALSFLVDCARDSSVADPDFIKQARDLIAPLLNQSRNFGEMMALAHSELSEALEEHSDGKPPVYFVIKWGQGTSPSPEAAAIIERFASGGERELTDDERVMLLSEGIAKPEGAGVELADVIIRCLDTLKDALDGTPFTINQVVDMKMRYNASRPFKHGRAY